MGNMAILLSVMRGRYGVSSNRMIDRVINAVNGMSFADVPRLPEKVYV